MEKRITWIQNHPEVCNAYNSKEEHLGSLQYERVGRFMHWCWYQMDDIRMSPGCLQEVRDKQKELCNLKNSAPKGAKTNKDLEVSASPTPKESQKAIPSHNPDIKSNQNKEAKQ